MMYREIPAVLYFSCYRRIRGMVFMTVRLRTRALATAGAGLVLAAISPGVGLAAAPATTPTQITLTVSPSSVAYPGPQTLTLSGVLETPGGTAPGLPGQTIQLNYFYAQYGESLGSVTTGAGGVFTWTGTLPDQPGTVYVPGSFTADFDGTSQYAQTGDQIWPQPARQFPARIVLNPIAPANFMSTVDVTGQVQMQVGTGWVPSPYAEIGLAAASNPYDCPAGGSEWGYADASGDFSLPVAADPGTDQCTIVTRPTGNVYQWSLPDASPAPVAVPLVADPTWVLNLSAAPRQTAPSLQVMTTIDYLPANDKAQAYTGPVQLQYQAPGATTWTRIAVGSPVRGWTTFTVSAFGQRGSIRAGHWRLVVQPESARYLGTSSGPFPIAVTVPTRLSARLTGLTLTGRLAYLARGGALARATVEIQKLIRGRWRDVAAAVTSGSGGYNARLHGAGTYRVAYGGSKLPGAQASFGNFGRAVSNSVRLR
jgi:hypothetical protein